MTAEQLLQDAIIDLQKRNLCLETRRLVDEAAQLLADGRDLEARALVEKAQAIAAPELPSNGITKGDGPTPEKIAQTIISRISNRLAEGIATVLTEAVQELHVNFGAQISEVASSLEGRLADITSQLKNLHELQQRVDRMEQDWTAGASAVHERWERLSASVMTLQETDRARQAEAEQVSHDISAALEMITSRVAAQEERLQVLTGLVQELSSKASSFAEQIDRQTGHIRSMQARQAQRAAALNAVLEGIAKLRDPEPELSDAAAAG